MSVRAQMEVMGLAIVMVLITLAILFVVQFSLSGKEAGGVKASYEDAQLASNLINAMLQTTAPGCQGHIVRKLVSNCAVNPPDGTIRCEATRDMACTAAANNLRAMLAASIGRNGLNRRYNFSIPISGFKGFSFDETGASCRTFERKSVPVQTDVGTLNVVLQICS